MTIKLGFAGVVLSLVGTMTMAADEPKPVQQHNSNALWFENWVGLRNSSMTVSDPTGEVTTIYAETGTPVFQLKTGEVQDGIYRYELKAATNEEVKIVNQIDNGRGDAQRDTEAKPFYLNGQFTVSRGVIVVPEEIKEE